MDYLSIKQEITAKALTNSALKAALDASDFEAVTTLASVGRVSLHSVLMSERGALSALGPVDGDAFLTSLENFIVAPPASDHPLFAYYGAIKRAHKFLLTDGIDIGDPIARSLLDGLAMTGVVTADAVAKVKAKAETPDPFNLKDVVCAFTEH